MAGVDTRGQLLDRTELDAFFGILLIQQRLTAAVDACTRERLNLSFGAAELILRLREARNPPRMSELAEAVLLSRTRVSRVISELVEAGLVARLERGEDARESHLVLTPTGEEAADEAMAAIADAVRQTLIDRLERADVEALAAAWRKSGTISHCE